VVLTTLALASVAASWLLVNTVYMLRYAHLYYGGDAIGGMDLPGGAPPDSRDFM